MVEDLVSALVSDIGTIAHINSIKPSFDGGKGIIGYMADDFDERLEDFKEYMQPCVL